ncbi:septum formation initiator [Streptomyces sp. Ru71]|uniref:septum formation initiator n=1 Tax=Streptomyces sp. Ru71 TaxID=2080746 RepID=UPI000CDD0DC4|nr:septum formation initiator [Streptomyces sp. Ru71]POX51541.1 septum formation initiator [Streptomyces sp. Ru71]
MTPLIIVTLVALWQCVLVGYTYTLAGNAADEAVRAGTAAEPGARDAACRQAGTDKLSGPWRGAADIGCVTADGYVTARVSLEVPILFPGVLGFPFKVHGSAGAVEEAKH